MSISAHYRLIGYNFSHIAFKSWKSVRITQFSSFKVLLSDFYVISPQCYGVVVLLEKVFKLGN